MSEDNKDTILVSVREDSPLKPESVLFEASEVMFPFSTVTGVTKQLDLDPPSVGVHVSRGATLWMEGEEAARFIAEYGAWGRAPRR